MNNSFNNPFTDMFKNPMNMWSPENWNKSLEMFQSYDFSKNFNPEHWAAMSSSFMKNAPWINKMCKTPLNLADTTNSMESFAEIHKISLESAQAMLRRQAEIIQKHSSDIYTLMQNMVSSPNPEAAMSVQSEYIQMAFETLMSDFKELMEMYSKANLETFEAASKKVSENMHKYSKAACDKKEGSCHSHDHNEHMGKEENSKKTPNKK